MRRGRNRDRQRTGEAHRQRSNTELLKEKMTGCSDVVSPERVYEHFTKLE